MKKPKFPSQIFVTRETGENADDRYLNVYEDPDTNFDHGQAVAVYKLVDVKKAKVVRTLE